VIRFLRRNMFALYVAVVTSVTLILTIMEAATR